MAFVETTFLEFLLMEEPTLYLDYTYCHSSILKNL